MRVSISSSPSLTVAKAKRGGIKAFKEFNEGCEFPAKVFGHWRTKPARSSDSNLPFPVKLKVEGYDKKAFLAELQEIQKYEASNKGYRGFSPHRWTGEPNGTSEYRYNKMAWPIGAMAYLKAGVPPSRAFYKAIMGKDLPALPY